MLTGGEDSTDFGLWCSNLGLDLRIVQMNPNFQGRLVDALFFGSRVMVVCEDAFEMELKDLAKDRDIISVSSKQVMRFCCSLVELTMATGEHGILVSKNAFHTLSNAQQDQLRQGADFIIECELDVCEAIGIGSARDLVISCM